MNELRRGLLQSSAAIGAGLFITGLNGVALASAKHVSPVEDLMREHGCLNRVLIIYDDAVTKLDHMKDFNPELLKRAAVVVQDFVEGYHEKMEEDFLFPRLRKAGKLADLVKTLDAQHSGGRLLTATIISLSTVKSLKTAEDQAKLRRSLAEFVRMYRPHEAYEDTVLFPEFKKIISEKDYLELGAEFERRETKKFGINGFETVLGQIVEIEKGMGLGDLNQFTSAVSPKS